MDTRDSYLDVLIDLLKEFIMKVLPIILLGVTPSAAFTLGAPVPLSKISKDRALSSPIRDSEMYGRWVFYGGYIDIMRDGSSTEFFCESYKRGRWSLDSRAGETYLKVVLEGEHFGNQWITPLLRGSRGIYGVHFGLRRP